MVDWASVHDEMSNILCVLVVPVRSLIPLTGPAGSLLVPPPNTLCLQHPARASLFNCKSDDVTSLPQTPQWLPSQGGSQGPHGGPQGTLPIRSLVSTPLARPILLWPLRPTWCSSDFSRMLSLEASPLHVSTSDLISFKSAHRSPDHSYLKLQPLPKPSLGPSPSL